MRCSPTPVDLNIVLGPGVQSSEIRRILKSDGRDAQDVQFLLTTRTECRAAMSRTEVITRPDGPPTAELAPGVALHLLATGSLGAEGLTTALATFRSLARLP